jgi:diguanylate cyclase (GGDEF)-like protein
MSAPQDEHSHSRETEKDRLDDLVFADVLTLDLVSAFAGDRKLTEGESQFIAIKQNSLGNRFYSELLYAITHQNFEPDSAKPHWQGILRHKYEMSSALKRNIRVAALDYLSNITGDIISTTLISEGHIADIIDASIRDGLTGLFNHTFFFRRAEIEINRSAQSGNAVSIMMIDIDDFKDYNDQYGHQEGDKILSRIAAIIKLETRHADICCRYGGEEFGVVLPGADRHEAMSLAERLRKAVETSLHERRTLTISIGIATAKNVPECSAEVLIKQADGALYKAKTTGKNRIVMQE